MSWEAIINDIRLLVSKAKPLLDSRLFKQGELKLPRIFESVLSEASLKYAIWRALDSDKLTVSGEAELTGGIIDLLVTHNDYSIGIECKDRISETDKGQMEKYRTSGLQPIMPFTFTTTTQPASASDGTITARVIKIEYGITQAQHRW